MVTNRPRQSFKIKCASSEYIHSLSLSFLCISLTYLQLGLLVANPSDDHVPSLPGRSALQPRWIQRFQGSSHTRALALGSKLFSVSFLKEKISFVANSGHRYQMLLVSDSLWSDIWKGGGGIHPPTLKTSRVVPGMIHTRQGHHHHHYLFQRLLSPKST